MTTNRTRSLCRPVTIALLGTAWWCTTLAGPAAAQEAPEVTLAPEPTVPVEVAASAAPSQAASTSLELSPAAGLDPDGQLIAVTGSGFAPGQGVYVMFCLQPGGALGTESGRADTCNPDQADDHTVWKTPIGADGTFTVDLRVESAFESTDCTTSTTPCGVFVRRDHMGGATDYSQDAFAAVSFASAATPTEPGAPVDPATPAEPTDSATGSADPTTVEAANEERLAATGTATAVSAVAGATLLGVGVLCLELARRRRPEA